MPDDTAGSRETSPRVILVTGGAKGIGRATCLAFLETGARVLCLDTDREAGESLLAEFSEAPSGELIFRRADVANAADCRESVQDALARWNHVDVLVNNAGIQPIDSYVPAHECSESLWDRILDVNLKSAFLMAREVLPLMDRQPEGGVILNVASVQGLQSAPLVPAYAASKGGLLSLTRQLAIDYSSAGIRVLAVNPGTIETPLVEEAAEARGIDLDQVRAEGAENHPIGRVGRPEEVARVIRFLAGPEAGFMTGEFVNVDGGLMAKGAWA